MSYYSVLGLEKEPFSTSPDPHFFYRASSHNSALKRLEISLRLRRGLNLIMGDVGIGKTTLSRALFQELGNDDEFMFHLILDPTYESEFQFLQDLAKRFQIKEALKSSLDYKEALEDYLLQNEDKSKKIIVLLIDEGQKLSRNNLEILRTLLNYETNEYKLLQIVILSQLEFLPRLKKIRNFFDRINLKYILNPLDQIDTHNLIEFRLKQAGYKKQKDLFTTEAISLIWQLTQGYPRRIAMFCHDALEKLVMEDKDTVDKHLIQKLIKEDIR